MKQSGKLWDIALYMIAAVVVVMGALGAVSALMNPSGPPGGTAPRPKVGIVQRLREPFPGRTQLNVLLLGCDDVEDVRRADTIMVLFLNPRLKRAALLSIPRDSRVHIPGHGLDRINHAYAFGEAELAQQTVEQFLGITVDYYAQVGFDAFVEAVDELGGVDIEVPDPFGRGKGMVKHTYYDSINLKPGYQHLDGKQALQFVRYRNDSDIERGKRQQQLLRALVDQKLNIMNSHRLLAAGSKIIEQLNTDIDWYAAYDFLRVLRQIPASGIMIGTVPIADTSINGVYYGEVREYDLRQLLGEINDHLSGVRRLAGTIEVCNGSGTAGVAAVAAERLAQSGFEIADVGNADSFEYHRTVINHRSGDREVARRVKEVLAVPDA
ncbi:MAG: LCP family protein, partial [Armatimonadetes bacterium]|nr:LCP family protein [Armatimonadota bacterium]